MRSELFELQTEQHCKSSLSGSTFLAFLALPSKTIFYFYFCKQIRYENCQKRSWYFFLTYFFMMILATFLATLGNLSKKQIKMNRLNKQGQYSIYRSEVLGLCCIYCVCSVVRGKVDCNCDLKFSGPCSWYLVVRNRINIAMNDRMETENCFLRSVSIEKIFLKKAEIFPNNAISECSSKYLMKMDISMQVLERIK